MLMAVLTAVTDDGPYVLLALASQSQSPSQP
jgi:hypothetical protein